MESLYLDTLDKQEYFRSLGYEVVVEWECEWEKVVKERPDIKKFLRLLFDSMCPRAPPVDLDQFIEEIRSGAFFGFVRCDIHVPEELEHKFEEMAPIFKHAEVGEDDFGEYMSAYAKANDQSRRPRSMLIGSLHAKGILLFSTLLRWYLEQGLVVTNVQLANEYKKWPKFRNFGLSVSDARRAGDVDPSLSILADTNKLVGNSCYGKMIVNQDKHRDVCYVEGDSLASLAIADKNFESLTQLDEEGVKGPDEESEEGLEGMYELTMFKKRVSSIFLCPRQLVTIDNFFFIAADHHQSNSPRRRHSMSGQAENVAVLLRGDVEVGVSPARSLSLSLFVDIYVLFSF
jgi:hypothetical protein